MTNLPEGEIFYHTDGGEDSQRVAELSDEWTLEELHQDLVNNEYTTLSLGRLLEFSGPDVIDSVLDGLRQNTSIESFSLHSEDAEFSDETQLAILDAVSSLPNLQDFCWWYSQWSNRVFQALSDFVSTSKLKSYSISIDQKFRTLPSEEEFKERHETSALLLANSVRENGTLENLRISFQLSPSGLAKLFDAIVTAGTVRTLGFSENGGHPYLEHLTEAMSLQEHNTMDACANSRLEKIDFGTDESIPNDQAAQALCRLAELHPRLVHVDLETMSVPDPDVFFLLDWNRYGRPLLSLDTSSAAIFETLEEVNKSRTDDGHGSDDEDDRPEMNSTSITYKILHEVCLPNSLFGGSNK